MHFEELLIRDGPLAVLLGAAFEGDITLILAGVLARLGIISYPLAIGAAVIGSFCGDMIWYTLGRVRGPWVRGTRLYQRVGGKIEELAGRIGAWELLAARFVYGTKAASMVFWGLHGLPLIRFALIDSLACVIGAFAFISLGYLVGGSAEVLIGKVRHIEQLLLSAIFAAAVLAYAINRAAKRELHIDDRPRDHTSR
jgi:membrane protein DedA with SNARE-associated domain